MIVIKENERFNINGNIMYWVQQDNGSAMLYMDAKETERLSKEFTVTTVSVVTKPKRNSKIKK